MLNFILGLVVGAVVMDVLWAWKTGVLRLFWRRIRSKDVDFDGDSSK